jgi:hypothetical protein
MNLRLWWKFGGALLRSSKIASPLRPSRPRNGLERWRGIGSRDRDVKSSYKAGNRPPLQGAGLDSGPPVWWLQAESHSLALSQQLQIPQNPEGRG